MWLFEEGNISVQKSKYAYTLTIVVLVVLTSRFYIWTYWHTMTMSIAMPIRKFTYMGAHEPCLSWILLDS